MRALRRAVLVLIAIALALVVADGPTAAAPPLALVALRGSGAVLTFEAGADTVDTGRFALTVPGLGTFVPGGPAEVRRDSAGNVHASYSGPADRYLTPDAAPVAASIVLQLNVQVAGPGPRGEAEVQVANQALHLRITQAPAQLSNAVLVTFEAAMRSSDWNGLYGLLSSDLAGAMTGTAFAADASRQAQSLGTITSLRRISVGTVRTSAQGVIYAVARYDVSRAGAGATSTYDAYFVYEDTGWKLWFTATR